MLGRKVLHGKNKKTVIAHEDIHILFRAVMALGKKLFLSLLVLDLMTL